MSREQLEAIIRKLPSKEQLLLAKNTRESAVLIPIVNKGGELFLLFEKRSQYVSQPGEICFPGGMKDPDDNDFEMTAVRETVEEIGLHEKEIVIIGKLGVLTGSRQLVIHAYVGLISWESLVNARYNQEEVEEICLVSLDELSDTAVEEYRIRMTAYNYEKNNPNQEILPVNQLGLPERYNKEWDLGYRHIYLYNLSNLQIWGLTGELVKHFIELYLQ